MPMPFHLSRSNSRRAKDVLQQKKLEEEKKEEEELERLTKENKVKSKPIPKNHYIPFVAMKSTKGLTNFKEFTFNNTMRRSSASQNP
jgi:hypothetical protein